jgi:hypothetical protein
VYFDFVKYPVVSLPSHSKRAFLVFLEYSLRIISGTYRAGKNLKTDLDSTHKNFLTDWF